MSTGHAESREKYIVPGLRRGLELLRLFSRERPTLGAPEIAAALALPRSTVFRLAYTLVEMGFLERADDGRSYRLGPAALGIGFDYLASLDLVDMARPVLERLRDDTGMSSHMAIRDGRDVIYVSRYPGRSAFSGSVDVGTRLPAHATVMGRLLLADLSDDELEALYRDQPLPAYTAHTPADLTALKALLRRDRLNGYAVSQSYFEPGVTAVAAPVLNGEGRVAAVINLTAVDAAIEPAVLEGPLKDRLCAAAARISAWLSYKGGAARRPAAE